MPATREARSTAKSGIEGRRRAAIAEGKVAYTTRRREVIEAAASVFRELGFEAATLNDVAAKLNTDRASLYYYVGSKEELLHEIVLVALSENVAAAERVSKRKGSTVEKIEALVEEMISSFDRNYPHMFVYTADMGRIAREESDWARAAVANTKRFQSILVSILEKGRAEGTLRSDLEPELCALALFGMVNWTHRWYRPGSKYTPEEVARTFSSLFLAGYMSASSPGSME
jgi:AcrR family transcriptional regulator